MNAKLLRQLVDRHAPDSVKESLQKLDKLEHEKRALNAKLKEATDEIIFGAKPIGEYATCRKCGQADPLLGRRTVHANGYHLETPLTTH